MNNRADWLAWSLQFLLGLIIGALGGFAGSGRSRFGKTPIIPPEHSLLFSLGLALCGGALTSYFGDRLWLGDSYRVIPPDGPQHSFASRLVSILAGCSGCILTFIALARTFGWFA